MANEKALKNKVQLITYADALGGDLKALNAVLTKYFMDIFEGGVHILPPFPSSGDRGFAPTTYFEIEPSFGTWDDMKAIGEHFGIAVDLMINHISQRSEYFQDFLKKGRKSRYADFFLTLDKIWQGGEPVKADLDKVALRRPVPYSEFTIEETGERERVWTTFGASDPSEQIDLDVQSPAVQKMFREILTLFAENGVRMVRLDAVGYVLKKPGTSCFCLEPEMYDYISEVKQITDALQIDILPEVHADIAIQYRLARRGVWIYDFIMPYMVLDTLLFRRHDNLYKYLEDRPENQFVTLDCHDGIPVKPDLDGMIDEADALVVVNKCLERGARITRVLSESHKGRNGFDVHQIVCTYYEALGCDDDAYLAARAIQFFVPGIPQVYYVGMLAGKNDTRRADLTGDNREMNRHNYTLEEVDDAVGTSVVQRLMALARFRNRHPAFDGTFETVACPKDRICMRWTQGEDSCTLHVDLGVRRTYIVSVADGREERIEV